MVKVLGFTDVERHSLNTLFRLSTRRVPAYQLWTAGCGLAPAVALIDVDSYEASVEMESPSFNPHLRVIAIGSKPSATVWRSFPRPVDWVTLVRELDALFAVDIDIDIDVWSSTLPGVPLGVTVCLVVGLSPEDRLYLRARLALAGHTEMDEAMSAIQASEHLAKRHYDLLIIGLELEDADPWAMVEALYDMPTPPRSVILATRFPTWHAIDRAEQLGCAGLLEIPFSPQQVMGLLQKI